MFIGVWINIQVFSLTPLFNLSLFMQIPNCFHYCSSVIELDVKGGDASNVLLLYRVVWTFLGFLIFHMKLSIVLSRSKKNYVVILMVIALNL